MFYTTLVRKAMKYAWLGGRDNDVCGGGWKENRIPLSLIHNLYDPPTLPHSGLLREVQLYQLTVQNYPFL